MKKPASSIQHGGDHYTKMVIQPFRMSLANRYDGASHSILKYVSRFGDKGGPAQGKLDLQKAGHIALIRAEELARFPDSQMLGLTVIEPETYCHANKISGLAREIIMMNHRWATLGPTLLSNVEYGEKILEMTDRLIAETYGEAS